MKHIMKKAGISLLMGAASMLGTWATKYVLDETKKHVDAQKSKKDK